MSKIRKILLEYYSRQINEVIPKSIAKNLLGGVRRSDRAINALNDMFEKLKSYSSEIKSSKRGERLFYPIGFNRTGRENNSDLMNEIDDVLSEMGYNIEDYILGTAYFENVFTGVVDKRKFNIGKLLVKAGRKDLLDKFNGDPMRSSGKKTSGYIVFSKFPYDILGMSTGRGWNSCMNLEGGERNEYIPMEVDNGTFMAYLINPDDINIEKPIARIAIKPYENMENINDVLFVPNETVYGSAPILFYNTVHSIFNEIQKVKLGEFKLNSSVYNDNMPKYKSKWTDETLKQNPGMLLNMESSERVELLKKHPEYSRVIVNITGDSINNFFTPETLVSLLKIHPKIIDDVDITKLPLNTIDKIVLDHPELNDKVYESFGRFKKNLTKEKYTSGNLGYDRMNNILMRFPEFIEQIDKDTIMDYNVHDVIKILNKQPQLVNRFLVAIKRFNTSMLGPYGKHFGDSFDSSVYKLIENHPELGKYFPYLNDRKYDVFKTKRI